MPTGFKQLGTSKPLEKWTNKDLLLYFSDRLADLSGQGLKLEASVEWIGFTSRVKGFRSKLNLNPTQYKIFIDKVFDTFAVKNKCTPVFGSIVSERVYNVIQKYCSKTSKPQYSDFEAVKNELYGNNLLFKKFS